MKRLVESSGKDGISLSDKDELLNMSRSTSFYLCQFGEVFALFLKPIYPTTRDRLWIKPTCTHTSCTSATFLTNDKADYIKDTYTIKIKGRVG